MYHWTKERKTNTVRRWSALAVVAALAAGTASPAVAGDSRGWQLSGTGYTAGGMLQDVEALRKDDAWAVGSAFTAEDGSVTTLALHWDGKRWTRVKTDVTGVTMPSLVGVDGTSHRDVWAVGWSHRFDDDLMRVMTHIEHWDGRRWERVPSPNRGSVVPNGAFRDVDARTRSDAWAVGSHMRSHGGDHDEAAYTARWDGTRWTEVPVPAAHGEATSLLGVAAVSKHEAWAVGRWQNGELVQPLVERWDGERWQPVRLPDLPGGYLRDVVVQNRRSVWAVGEQDGRPLVLHWDGTAWNVRSPRLDARVVWLHAVTVDASTGDVHTVGEMVDGQDRWRTVSMRWSQNRWHVVTTPRRSNDDMLRGISFAGGHGFAVGEYLTGQEATPEQVLVLRMPRSARR